MIVFHGSAEIVEGPDVLHSYRQLDFGKGFYVTTVEEQARRWARRKKRLLNRDVGIVNKYDMGEYYSSLVVKTFDSDLTDWIDFVCACRDGSDIYLEYDVIIGMVANDKVFRVVDMYHSGIWDKERAFKEIKVYPAYDQMVFISQKAIDSLLTFRSFEEV